MHFLAGLQAIPKELYEAAEHRRRRRAARVPARHHSVADRGVH